MSRSAERGGGGRLGQRAALAAVLGLIAAGAALGWRHRDALLDSALFASPATQVRRALDQMSSARIDREGAAVELVEVRFADVAAQAAGDRVEVIAMVEGRGTVAWRGQRIALGYVGREAFTMVRCPARRWCSEGPLLPALEGILSALEARVEAAAPAPRVEAWQIRVERDRATAGEDLVVDGPAGAERRRELHPLRRSAGRWEIVDVP